MKEDEGEAEEAVVVVEQQEGSSGEDFGFEFSSDGTWCGTHLLGVCGGGCRTFCCCCCLFSIIIMDI